jgi:thiamine-monophosphate kinase
MASAPTSGSLPGEFVVIGRYFAPLTTAMPGALGLTDDVCTWQPGPGEELVLKVDALVADVHFLRSDPAASVARKLMRVNLSDLAAKGAKPVGYLLTVAVDASVDENWLRDFAAGLAQDQQIFDFHLMGGDTVKTPGPISLTLTAIGTVPQGTALRRVGAQPGDRLFVTGTIGDGVLGLQVLRHHHLQLSAAHRQFLAGRYQVPEPRVAFGQALRAQRLASAAMDVSDGLVADLGHLAKASGCGAILHAAATPLSDAAAELVAETPDLLLDLMTGGDDYEILFAVPPDKIAALKALAQEIGQTVTEIGEVVAGDEIRILDRDNQPISLIHRGYSHF